jgi:hypothetical protein
MLDSGACRFYRLAVRSREVEMRVRRGVASVVAIAGALALIFGLAACRPLPPPGGGGGSTTTTTTIPAGGQIRPNQHFVGLVNGDHADAVVYVACAGPSRLGGTGPPVGGQTVAVHRVASGGGFTGSAAQFLAAEFDSDPAEAIVFGAYDAPGEIPITAEVPCEGTGTVRFTSCFGLAPCPSDAVDYVVSVTFVNLAV